jgi:hypothetical protein
MPIAIMSIRAYRDTRLGIAIPNIGYDSILTARSPDTADEIDRLQFSQFYLF